MKKVRWGLVGTEYSRKSKRSEKETETERDIFAH